MKVLYVECYTGIAGDMFAGALFDLLKDNALLAQLQGYMPKNIVLSAQTVDNHGLAGTRFSVKNTEWAAGAHHGHGLEAVNGEIENTSAPDSAKAKAKGVYKLLAEAEAKAHNVSVAEVHFHEVGELRASMAILCACALIEKISPDKIIFSPINTGFGEVQCAHGIMKVPTPATANLLDGLPAFCVDGLQGELCTPTGAALVKYFAESFGEMPDMKKQKTGVGIGGRDIGTAGGVKLFFGEIE